jgi:hypothetical protein
MVAELAVQMQCLTYIDIELVACIGIGRRESPDIFQQAVYEYYILLVCWVENMLNMFEGQSIIAEVLVDKSPHDFNPMHHPSLLTENGVAKPFEDMLVVLICHDIVNTNESVKEIQMGE